MPIVPLLAKSRATWWFSTHRPLSESITRVDGSLLRMCLAGEQRESRRGKERGEKPVYTGWSLQFDTEFPRPPLALRYTNTDPSSIQHNASFTSTRGIETRNLRLYPFPSTFLAMSPPLPPTTANDAVNDLQAGSRKRLRSLSMQSDSSSPKRSASEDPTQESQKDISDKSARPSPLPSESTPTLEDSPMNDGSILSQDVPMPPSPFSPVDPSTIDPVIIRPLQTGETWYIVTKRWMNRWRKAFSGQEDKEEGVITEATLGPPDKENHSLLDERGYLRKDVTSELVDFVPDEVWDLFVSQ